MTSLRSPLRFASTFSVLAACFWGAPATADIYVKNTNDSGPGSLRAAILKANAAPGPETILFQISGVRTPYPPYIISPTSPLPPITNTVSIIGPKNFEVVLDGSRAGGVGLWLQGTGSTVRSMVINNGWDSGIGLDGGGGHKIDNNRIGTDATGLTETGNYVGIFVQSSNNHIGVGGRNVVSGNDFGIYIRGSGNQVQGNYIGPNASGQNFQATGGTRQEYGVLVEYGTRNTITSNLITGKLAAVFLLQSSSNVVVANRICMDAAPPWNTGYGVGVCADNNVIGSHVAGGENIIAHCSLAGVVVCEQNRGNSIRGNRIYDLQNGALAIDLDRPIGPTPNDPLDADSGANNLQNAPRILDAYFNGFTLQVLGELESRPNSTYAVDVYASPVDPGNGSCETPSYLGSTSVTTDAAGRALFFLTIWTPVAPGQFVSATATASTGSIDTSEVSPCRIVTGRFP